MKNRILEIKIDVGDMKNEGSKGSLLEGLWKKSRFKVFLRV